MPPPVTASLAMPAPAAGALRAFLDHLVSKHGRGLEPGPGSRRLGGTAPGRVALVGAGPGDPELLTLRAARLIGEADVLVLDHLVGEGVLELARPGTERIYVGKESGHHTLPQDDINQLLVDLARQGKRVLRLKGGDPFIFGRGGEEAEALVAAGVPFEVVPGVTAGAAAAAYAGIPVTQRGLSSSVAFITGHEDACKLESAHDWQALAHGAETLVFYMGVKNLPEICRNLLKAGLPAGRPAGGAFGLYRHAANGLESARPEAYVLGMNFSVILALVPRRNHPIAEA